jgi:proteasome assembly chaperone (PAC2) family protein
MGDKFSINVGPGCVIGATAIGPGATAHGSVTVGGPPTDRGERLRATLDVRGATSHRDLADLLEQAAIAIRKAGPGGKVGAIGSVTGDATHGIAWTIDKDN